MRLGTVDVLGRRAASPRSRASRPSRRVRRQRRAVVVDLQRADAGGEVDDAGQLRCLATRLHQQMDAQPQRDIERHRAVFDQQVVVALRGDRRPAPDRRRPCRRWREPASRRGRWIGAGRRSGSCRARSTGVKADGVAGLELAHLPQLVARDHRRADEAAEARAVGAEDDRHVAGEIDGADGVGVVVEVGGMQARLAAVAARPFRRGADEADAGAGAVEVHLVGGREQRLDVFGGEEVRRAVRAVEDADLPVAA